MHNLLHDLRYGFRILAKYPGFSITAVLALGIGIGANSAIFSVVNAVVLRPLPFAAPDRLVMVFQDSPSMGVRKFSFSAPDFVEYSRQARTVENVAAYQNRQFELSGVTQPSRVAGLRCTAGLIPLLGVTPALGRFYSAEEDAGRAMVAVLSDGLWRREFGADPAILGRPIVLDRLAYTIVGVMPGTFRFPLRGPVYNHDPADVFVPMSFTDEELAGFGMMYNNSVIARLRPGITLAQADVEAQVVVSRFLQQYPAALRNLPNFEFTGVVSPYRDEVVGKVQSMLLFLMGAVGLVLLIGCADVANLLLTRGTLRRREMAVRSALGAGRGRLAAQVLVETLALSLLGGAAGLVIAQWGTDALVSLAPVSIPRAAEIAIDSRVLVFTLLLCVVAALLSGLAPALGVSGRGVAHVLKETGPTGTAGRRPRRILAALVTAQFALALVLLVAAGLLARSFSHLMNTNPGFDSGRVLTMSTSLPGSIYSQAGQIRNFYRELVRRARSVPGVEAAAVCTDLPLSVHETRAFSPEGPFLTDSGPPRVTSCSRTIGDLFAVLRIPLRAGRYFTDQDGETGRDAVIINETMARMFWPGTDPVGRRVKWGAPSSTGRWMTIVGVVGDVKNGPLNTEVLPQVYEPFIQVADEEIGETVTGFLRSLTLLARTTGNPRAQLIPLRNQIRALDSSLPVTTVQTLEQVVDSSVASERFNAFLLVTFAVVALSLAALGIHGTMAYSVSQRTAEIGIRVALGAPRAKVLGMVLRHGMLLACAGIVAGLVISWQLARFLSSLLFGISPRDPWTFVVVPLVLVAVALLSTWFPARRAARVNPITAIRR